MKTVSDVLQFIRSESERFKEMTRYHALGNCKCQDPDRCKVFAKSLLNDGCAINMLAIRAEQAFLDSIRKNPDQVDARDHNLTMSSQATVVDDAGSI